MGYGMILGLEFCPAAGKIWGLHLHAHSEQPTHAGVAGALNLPGADVAHVSSGPAAARLKVCSAVSLDMKSEMRILRIDVNTNLQR